MTRLSLSSGFLSWIMKIVVLLPRMNLLLQGYHMVGEPVGSHVDSC
jgi:hypothetical protein